MRRAFVVAGVITGAVVSACSDEGTSAASWTRAVAGLCAAADEARAGDGDDARRTFFDQSHDDLHELADEASTEDRAAAAELLRAKEAVESDFETSSPSLADDLDALVAATRASARAIGAPVPAGCD
jgi:hypothetical protein